MAFKLNLCVLNSPPPDNVLSSDSQPLSSKVLSKKNASQKLFCLISERNGGILTAISSRRLNPAKTSPTNLALNQNLIEKSYRPELIPFEQATFSDKNIQGDPVFQRDSRPGTQEKKRSRIVRLVESEHMNRSLTSKRIIPVSIRGPGTIYEDSEYEGEKSARHESVPPSEKLISSYNHFRKTITKFCNKTSEKSIDKEREDNNIFKNTAFNFTSITPRKNVVTQIKTILHDEQEKNYVLDRAKKKILQKKKKVIINTEQIEPNGDTFVNLGIPQTKQIYAYKGLTLSMEKDNGNRLGPNPNDRSPKVLYTSTKRFFSREPCLKNEAEKQQIVQKLLKGLLSPKQNGNVSHDSKKHYFLAKRDNIENSNSHAKSDIASNPRPCITPQGENNIVRNPISSVNFPNTLRVHPKPQSASKGPVISAKLISKKARIKIVSEPSVRPNTNAKTEKQIRKRPSNVPVMKIKSEDFEIQGWDNRNDASHDFIQPE